MRNTQNTGKTMSFGQEIRQELLETLPQSACCRRSLLHGLLINAENGVAGMVMCRIPDICAAESARKLLLEQYGREPDTTVENCYGRKITVFEFESKRFAGFLGEISDPIKVTADIPELKCAGCRAAFLAGILSSAARFSDPDKEVRLEISISDPSRAERIACFFEANGEKPILSHRSESCSLIYKRSVGVQDILSAAGASRAAMKLIQSDLMREFRSNVNRASNCEIRNIGRSVSAAAEHLEAITFLREHGYFTGLPVELRETAELREREQECSISELAAKHSPPISKSGLNHRLHKLCAYAAKMKSKISENK